MGESRARGELFDAALAVLTPRVQRESIGGCNGILSLAKNQRCAYGGAGESLAMGLSHRSAH